MKLTNEQYQAFAPAWRDEIDSLQSRGHMVEIGEIGQLCIIEERTEIQVQRLVGNHYRISALGKNELGDQFAAVRYVIGEKNAIAKAEDLLDQALNHAYGHNGGGAA